MLLSVGLAGAAMRSRRVNHRPLGVGVDRSQAVSG